MNETSSCKHVQYAILYIQYGTVVAGFPFLRNRGDKDTTAVPGRRIVYCNIFLRVCCEFVRRRKLQRARNSSICTRVKRALGRAKTYVSDHRMAPVQPVRGFLRGNRGGQGLREEVKSLRSCQCRRDLPR
jgi:hypothetical protein